MKSFVVTVKGNLDEYDLHEMKSWAEDFGIDIQVFEVEEKEEE